MCWSADGSLATWALAMTLALASKRSYDPALWVFCLVFTQIQLVEYFLWKDMKNPIWSKAGLLVILLEPVAAIYLIKNKDLRLKFLIAYGAFVSTLLLTYKFDMSTEVGSNGHLKWNWIFSLNEWPSLAWFFFMFAPLVISGNYGTLTVAVGTLAMSAFFYLNHGTISSMWCWVAVFSWVLFFLKSNNYL